MNNIFRKTFAICLMGTLVTSCSDDDRFSEDTFDSNSGWVQFEESSTIVSERADLIELQQSVFLTFNVPEYRTDEILLNYSVSQVSGEDYNFYYNFSESITALKSNNNRTYPINLVNQAVIDSANARLGRVQSVFDLDIVSVSDPGITIGIEDTRPTSHRVIVDVCADPNIYFDATISEPKFTGLYQIQSASTYLNQTTFAAGSFVNLATVSGNPYARSFIASYFPAFGGFPIEFPFEFVFDPELTGTNSTLVVLPELMNFQSGESTVGLNCVAGGPGISIGGATFEDSTRVDTCGDDSTLVIQYYNGVNGADGGCNAPNTLSTIVLEKL